MFRHVRFLVTDIARKVKDTKRFQTLTAWASGLESLSRARAMLEWAHGKMAVLPERFDADPMVLNVANGIVDLATGDLLEHNRGRLCSRIMPVNYPTLAECPLWLAFLDRIFAGNAELIGFVQRAVGRRATPRCTARSKVLPCE